MENKKMLVIPGGFLPYNDTVTLLTYKRLRGLDYDMDVLALKGKADEGIKKELDKDINYKKFNIEYCSEYNNTITIAEPYKLPLGLINMFRYVRRSIRKAKEKKYDVLFTSSVPGITHICGKHIKKNNTDVEWWASFSDPIKGSPYKKDPDLKNRSIFYRIAFEVGSFIYMNNRYEEAAVKYADKLIFICEEQRDFTISQYENKEELLKKSVIMPLTYIPEWDMYKELINASKVCNTPKMAVHLGRLYGLRKIDNFLEALKELKEEIPDLSDKIVFHQYSEIQPYDIKKIKNYNLEDVFVVHNKVSYRESVEIMKSADILVLFDTIMHDKPVQPYLPSKITEYLLLDRPILGICEDNSPSYRMLKDKHYVGNDVEDIKKNIRELIIRGLSNNY